MSDISLDEVKSFAAALSPLAHLATIGPDGDPDVVPVHPAWEGDTLWIMVHAGSVKVRNVTANPRVAMHWQVSEQGDGVELWGAARVHTDTETKHRLWTGVFDYDLDLFSPEGPDGPTAAFIAVEPSKALVVRAYGMNGLQRWRADG